MDVKDFKSRDIVFWGQLNGEDIMEVAGEQLKMVIEKQFRVKVQPRGKVNRGVIDVARELLSMVFEKQLRVELQPQNEAISNNLR